MNKALITFTIIGLFFAGMVRGQSASDKRLTLWYQAPAAEWEEALPLSNSKVGAMVFGGVPEERIQFNEETVWGGKPRSYARPDAYKCLEEIRGFLLEMRKSLRAGETEKALEFQLKAEELAEQKFMGSPLTQASFQPMGDLFIAFPDHKKPENYHRELNLQTGLSKVTYVNDGVGYTRETIGSYPDQCIITRITADKAGSVSCSVRLAGPYEGNSKTAPVLTEIKSVTDDTIILRGKVVDSADKRDKTLKEGVIEFETHVQVSVDGGSITKSGQQLKVEGANSVTIKLVAATNFENFMSVAADPNKRCVDLLKPIAKKSFDDIYRAHLADFQPLFNRVSLDLGSVEASNTPTDVRVKNFVKNQDYDLLGLIFQLGRYMGIVGSREGSLPLNLLGKWTLRPAWGSKYTCNINIEMNYWQMNPTAIPECNLPLFAQLEQLSKSGAITAKAHYNADGWVLHHNWDLWCGTAPLNKSNHGTWTSGSGWMVQHIWEHYLFTGDTEVLKKYYPIIKGAVLFYTQFLYKDEITGHLITGPGASPEHGGMVAGPTMDRQIIRSLFKQYLLMTRILGDEGELSAKVAGMVGQIAPNQVGPHGELMEWMEPDPEVQKDTHRHLSHLWGVFPGYDITWKDTELFNAAKQSLIYRGDGQTGWSLAWKLNLWARLLDGEHALTILNNHVLPPGASKVDKKGAGFYPNLFNANPPFVADGNFGVTSGITEMLIQSHMMSPVAESGPLTYNDLKFMIHILPAIPATWDRGSFQGLRARGGFAVDCSWEAGKVKSITIKSEQGNPCQIKYGDKIIDLNLKKGESKTLSL